jgi:hypothetical protein
MITLIVTYVVAWAAICAYGAWLAIGSRKLVRRLDRLEIDAVVKPPDLTQVKPAA